MAKEPIYAKVKVPTIGKPEDYEHLPIIKDDKPIGIINYAIEENHQYMLHITLWVDIDIELFVDSKGKKEPSAVIFNKW